jgi:hypothetical protein
MIVNSALWLKPAAIVSRIADSDANEKRYHAGSLYYQLKNKVLVVTHNAHDNPLAIMAETCFPLGAKSPALVAYVE